jgi:hypothetical protein
LEDDREEDWADREEDWADREADVENAYPLNPSASLPLSLSHP